MTALTNVQSTAQCWNSGRHVSTLAVHMTLVAEPGECPKTRCGPRGKGSRCGALWGGLGACRHEQKTSAEQGWLLYPWNPRSWGRSHMRPPRGRETFSLGQGNHRRWGAQLEAAAGPVTGPALIICQATPQRPAAGPKGLGHPAT